VALVEFAICLPFLALIVFGTLDVGRTFLLTQRAKNAARAGAFYAARYPGRQVAGTGCTDPDTVTWQANHEGSGTFTVLVNNVAATCTTAPSGVLAPGNPIKVTVKATYVPFTPLAGRFLGSTPTVSASVCTNIIGATPNGNACP
jgi:Flp pilus assembly protein TadG